MALDVRPLTSGVDAAIVRAFYDRAADYVALETGLPPDAATVEGFFEGRPPGSDLGASLKLGLFRTGDLLIGIADMGFGFPDEGDAYIGLMLLDPDCRGQGFGSRFLAHLADAARSRGAPRLLLAVLDENARGRAFWEREGFRVVRSFPSAAMGPKSHARHRMELLL